MDITINVTDGVPIYRQIVNQVKYLVASGLLQPGEELPPIRTLALQLKVTPNTIVKAYGELEIAGVVHKRRGSGTFVSEGRPQLALRERRRIIEQRIDALLAEAHQLNFTADDILRMVRERKAAMDPGPPPNRRTWRNSMGQIVDVNDLSRSFGSKSALDGVSFRATAGQVYGLVGANGAGKTTLLKHLLGLLRATTGSVRVFGLDPVRDPVGVLSRVGYLSEERELPEWMRVDELMRYTQAFHPTWDASYARELLETFALDPSKKVKELSKGMRAQAGLIAAVAHRPELLILDEPSSGLDAVVRRDILDAIVRTVADDGRTVIFSSHLLDEVERMSDHVTLMHHGPRDAERRTRRRAPRLPAQPRALRRALRSTARPRYRAGHGRWWPHVERRPQRIARAVPSLGPCARRRGRRIARRHARRNLPGARRPQPPAGGGGMTMRSPIVAMLWEIWRVTRVEAAWKLAFGIVGGLAVLALCAAFAPADNAKRYEDIMDNGAAVAMILLVLPHLVSWLSLARLNGGRPGFPLYLHYTRPVRTAVIVGLPMAYLTAMSSAIYLVSALLLRVTSGYAFPLLPVAAWIAALTLVGLAATWSTRNRTIQVCVMMFAITKAFGLAMERLTAVEIPDTFDWPPRLWPTLFDFPLTDYAWIALIGLASFGVTVAGVTRQRRGDGWAEVPLGATRRILGPARQPVPFPVSHLVCDAGSGVVGPEVQRIAGADDRSGARDRDSAGVGGQRAHRCCDRMRTLVCLARSGNASTPEHCLRSLRRSHC